MGPAASVLAASPETSSKRPAVDFLMGLINFERPSARTQDFQFRLQRMRDLLRRLDLADLLHQKAAPESAPIPTIHIAGTKGKGSVAMMIAAGLSAAGVRTGLYTSPHLHHLEERFRIDGKPCRPDQLDDLIEQSIPICRQMADQEVGQPTFFELTTALALLHFRQQGCQAQVIEVGLGGRLDSTNVIQSSLSVITSIGLDHQSVLGHTKAAIAAEKAGIIKPGVPVISGVRRRTDDRPGIDTAPGQTPHPDNNVTCDIQADDDPEPVIRRIAGEVGTRLLTLGEDFDFRCRPTRAWGSEVEVFDLPAPAGNNGICPPPAKLEFHLGVEGMHQAGNAALAAKSLQILAGGPLTPGDESAGRQLPSLDIQRCVRAWDSINLPGRIERFGLRDGPMLIIDTAHNEDSITALVTTLEHRFGPSAHGRRHMVIVFGTSRDKDAGLMLRVLSRLTDRLVLTRFQDNPRYLPLDQLAGAVPPQSFRDVQSSESSQDAVALARRAAGPDGVVVVCGSFFLADEIRRGIQIETLI
ncbi:bifunctional folylpolyglutamate synthase/dihydrofolate synthase [Crateriforma conspicua]|uniref:Dihydrofolate synthase/folylpolyglutamate synthase n=1 Tax=Crateriforma conspicua TaxID=2527996 RepID=A0A5C5YAM0_9PLAN|nr:cyanophycin synthetase [Crateriforma conspicua]TWT72009.1 Folylpolyglutamate synthase [Crateriforma conspicua]